MKGTLSHFILKSVYINSLHSICSTVDTLSCQLSLNVDIVQSHLDSLLDDKLLSCSQENKYSVTSLGRNQFTVVLTTGTFDILHRGHLFILKQSRLLGDVLVVIVTPDKNVERQKGRTPAKQESERVYILNHINEVDAAILGHESDFIRPVTQIRPEIIALGYDQKEDIDHWYSILEKNDLSHVKIIRLMKYVPGKSTTKIFQQIMKRKKKL